jgi:hypothetical protein
VVREQLDGEVAAAWEMAVIGGPRDLFRPEPTGPKNPFKREDFFPFSDGMLVNPYKHKEFDQKGPCAD